MEEPKIQDMLAMKQISSEPLLYEMISDPPRLNASNRVYGGYTSAVAVQAAFHSLQGTVEEKDSWSIYSANGVFLGATMLGEKLKLSVTTLRHTRTFATFIVTATQMNKGTVRNCFCMTVDFIQRLPSSGPPHNERRLPLSYSVSPTQQYPHPDELDHFVPKFNDKVAKGEFKSSIKTIFDIVYGVVPSMLDTKMLGVMDETYMGTAPQLRSNETTIHPTQGRCSDYFRSRGDLDPILTTAHLEKDGVLPLTTRSIQAAFIVFAIDGPLSLVPLVKNGMKLSSAGSNSSLDLAIRFHDDEYDISQYHLREMRTLSSDRQRSFNEALVFNLDGKLIVSATQQCALTVKKNESHF